MNHTVLTKTPLLAGNTEVPRSVHGGGKKERGRRALTLERHAVLVGPRTAAVLLKESYLNDLTFKLQRLEEKPTVSSKLTQQIPPISCRCPFKIPPPKDVSNAFPRKSLPQLYSKRGGLLKSRKRKTCGRMDSELGEGKNAA